MWDETIGYPEGWPMAHGVMDVIAVDIHQRLGSLYRMVVVITMYLSNNYLSRY
jgi:hypothetical protein